MADKMPLVAAADRDTFGGVKDSAQFMDQDQMAQDVTFVPGYSDKRRHNALAATEWGKKQGLKKVKVEYRLHFARFQTPMGKPDARDVTSRLGSGYQFVTKDNITSLGIEAPPAAVLDPATGRYQVGDTVLMFCTRDIALRNENVLRRATEDRSSADATASDLHTEGRKQARSAGQDNLTEASVSHETEVRHR